MASQTYGMDSVWHVEATDHISQIITQATRYAFSLCQQDIGDDVLSRHMHKAVESQY